MEGALDKYFLLLNQAFALAEYLSLSVVVGIDMPSNRRCWSSNGKNFQFDLISNELTFAERDIWLKSGKVVGQQILAKDKLFDLTSDCLMEISSEQSMSDPMFDCRIQPQPTHSADGDAMASTFKSSEILPEIVEYETQQQTENPIAPFKVKDEEDLLSVAKDTSEGKIKNPFDSGHDFEPGFEPDFEPGAINYAKKSRSEDQRESLPGSIKSIECVKNEATDDESEKEKPRSPVYSHLLNPCSVCGVSFSDDEEGIKHYHKTHRQCVECGYQFKVYSSLTLHIHHMHRKLKRFRCNFCPNKFGLPSIKSRHMEDVHNFKPKPTPRKLKRNKHVSKSVPDQEPLKSKSKRDPSAIFVSDRIGQTWKQAATNGVQCFNDIDSMEYVPDVGKDNSEVKVEYHVDSGDEFGTLAANYTPEVILGEKRESEPDPKHTECVKIEETDESDEDAPPPPPLNLHLVNPCSLCGISYSEAEQGIKHYHECHYKCVECGQQLKTPQSLRVHISNMHRKLKLYQCNYCHEKFGHSASKTRHMKKVHNHVSTYKRKTLNQWQMQSASPRKGLRIEKSHAQIVSQKETQSRTKSLQSLKVKATNKENPPTLNLPLLNPCSKCGLKFSSDDEVVAHYHQTHQQCVECGQIFKHLSTLASHVKIIHRKLKRFQCSFCFEKFGHNSAKFRHMEKDHNYQRKIRDDLKKDLTEPLPKENSQKYTECGEALSEGPQQSQHACETPINSQLKPEHRAPSCLECLLSFETKEEHQAHLRNIHNKCIQCEKGFVQASKLKIHVETVHKKLKPFKCNKCNHSCTQKGNLRQHDIIVHQKKKDFICSFCGKGFPMNSFLQTHVAACHSLDRSHSCSMCSEKFQYACRLQRHIKLKHSKTTQQNKGSRKKNSLVKQHQD